MLLSVLVMDLCGGGVGISKTHEVKFLLFDEQGADRQAILHTDRSCSGALLFVLALPHEVENTIFCEVTLK